MNPVWAVVLNYRTPVDTVLAVRSLLWSEPALARIVVVDNASGDGSVAMIRRDVPSVDLMVAGSNGGFAAGCNIAIRAALAGDAGRVFLVNSDAVVRPDTVAALTSALDADASLAIVGPAVVRRRRPDEIESLGMSYRAATGRMRHYGAGTRWSDVKPFVRRDVDGVSGCAMLIERHVFERVGLLAEEYFFGFEDLELCLRAGGQGLKSACIGTTVVLHEGSRSVGRRVEARAYFAARNHLLLASRFPGRGGAASRAFQSAAVMGLNLAHAALRTEVPAGRALRGCARGIRDHFRGRYGSGA